MFRIFRSWHARRKFTKNKKHIKNLQRPSLPEGTKLISFPIHNTDGQNQNSRHGREWIMNPNGKSFVCILHEYVQHALKKQPTYEFKVFSAKINCAKLNTKHCRKWKTPPHRIQQQYP